MVVSRPTSLNDVLACGGSIEMQKWGYTFVLKGEKTSPAKTMVAYDCTFGIFFKTPPSRKDIKGLININCDPMPIVKSEDSDCPAYLLINNQQKFCHGKSQLNGLFRVINDHLTLRLISKAGNKFQENEPIFQCVLSAAYYISN